ASAGTSVVSGFPATARGTGSRTSGPSPSLNVKDALLAEIRKSKVAFYNTVVAQAQKIELAGDRMTFTFAPNQRALKDMLEEKRAWLESLAQQVSGRRIALESIHGDAAPASSGEAAAAAAAAEKKSALREQALADAGIQAMLEVFPAEIRDVEEM